MFTSRFNLTIILFLMLLAAFAGPTTNVQAVAGQNTAGEQAVAKFAAAQAATATPAPQPTTTPQSQVSSLPQGLSNEPLQVISTSPGKDAQEIATSPKETQIIIQFNHPVVPLVSVDAQKNLPQPLSFSPNLAGSGQWINTSTYAFTPSQNLAVATEYTVTVAPMTDMLGGTLQGFSWKFKTTSPAIVLTYPERSTVNAGASEPISVTFNTEMDRASVESRFSVVNRANNARVAGTFEWNGALMKFVPSQKLAYNTTFAATLKAGAQDINKKAVTLQDVTWTFRTTREPGVLTTNPKNGDKASVAIRNGFEITYASPMAQDVVTVTIQPTITNQYSYWENPTTQRISGGWLASQTYSVTISGQSETQFGEKLGKDTVITFTAAPLDPWVQLNVTGNAGVYDANRDQVIYASYRNIERINYSLYSVPFGNLLRLNGRDRYEIWNSYRPSKDNLVREWGQDVTSKLNATGIISTSLSGGIPPTSLLKPGAYYLTATSPELKGTDTSQPSRQLLIVTPYNLALKRTETEALVWATDLNTGKPVADLPITLYGADNKELGSGKTDADGVYRATFARQLYWEPLFAASLDGNNVLAAVSSDWAEGIQTFDFNLNTQYGSQEYYGNLYTDRPIYRPGQTVYFKGILRRDNDARYELPNALKTVPIKVYDANGREILNQNLPLNQYGTFNGEIQLNSAASLGFYNIQLELGQDPYKFYSSVGFQVAQYKAPEFQVDVKTDKPEYKNGETISVTLESTFFFGGPVSDAPITWRLLSDDLFFTTDKVKGYWDFTDYDLTVDRRRTGGVIREGKGTTDKQGKFSFTLPADLKDFPLSQNFTIDVEVTDINNQAVSNRVVVPVHKGDFYIGLRPQSYVGEVNERQDIDVITVNTQGDPYPNQPLSLSFFEHKWYSVRQQQDDGNFYWTSAYTDTLVSTQDLTTDTQGRATATFTPTVGGVFKIVAEGKDTRGNAVRSATYQWIATSEFVNWRVENNDRIDLVADKKSYNVGDTAEVLIPAPFRDAEALLTIERGSIRQVRHLTLQGNSEKVQIPITGDFIPTVYVSVMLVKGRGPDSPTPQFKLGYAALNVNPTEKLLNVTITPDKAGTANGLAEYQPGDEPTFNIEAKDAEGKPVQAEFSLALVDKAVQSLVEDNTTSLQQAFWGTRGIGVQTSASWVRSVERINLTLTPEAKGGGGGPQADTSPVRRNFQDTAFWKADVVTDESGKASVTVTLPDNLTTWNLTAKGVTQNTLVGTGRLDVLSTKPLLVRPVVPRFFVVGDEVQLEAVVNNNTDQDVTADVQLQVTGLTLKGNATQPLTVKARDRGKVVWQTTVDAAENVKVLMSAAGGGLNDALEVTLPIVRPTSGETVGTAGTVEQKAVEKIEVPANADKTAGGLQITVSPSLAAASNASLDYLKAFPYDCSEQTVSKFFPNIVTYQALKTLGIQNADLERNLSLNVSNQIQRLYQLQHGDGGWGWWADDMSRPHLTAYALYALWTAQQAQFPVDQSSLDRAVQYLNDYLDKPVDAKSSYGYDERAFVVFVLNEAKNGEYGSRAQNLYERRTQLDTYSKAYLMLALAKSNATRQAQALKSEILSAAIPSSTGTHWQEKEQDWYMMNTDTRSTAIVLYALSRVGGKDANTAPVLANVVRWLMTERTQGHWETTQETAWSVLGLTEYMVASGELNANYNYTVAVNGNQVGEGTVNKENITQDSTLKVAIKDLMTDTANELAIERTTGQGNLYYSAFLEYYLPVDQLKALNRGIIVARQYYGVDQATLEPTDKLLTTAKVGDYVQVKLTLVAPNDLSYVVLEDPLPAGFEAVDTSLRTSSAAASSPQLEKQIADCAACAEYYHPYWYYWAHSELRDDRVAAFADFLSRGTYEYTYLMRASVSGEFSALPTTAYQMYFPDVFGRGEGTLFTVSGE